MESPSSPESGAAAAQEEPGAVPACSARASALAARPARLGAQGWEGPVIPAPPCEGSPSGLLRPEPASLLPPLAPSRIPHPSPIPPLFTPFLTLHPTLPLLTHPILPPSPRPSFIPILLFPLNLHRLYPHRSIPPSSPHLSCLQPCFSSLHSILPSLHSFFFPLHLALTPRCPLPFPSAPHHSPAPSSSSLPLPSPHTPSPLPCFLYFLGALIPLLFLSPAPPSFPPSFVNRDERNPGLRPPASSSLPGSQSRGPPLQRPTWERLRAPSLGHFWQLERRQFSKGLALLAEAASLLLPSQGLGFKGGVLSGS